VRLVIISRTIIMVIQAIVNMAVIVVVVVVVIGAISIWRIIIVMV